MSISLPKLEQTELTELPTTIRNAGVAGAGGAGFPTHAKWSHLDEVPFLMINHQESEPNYYIDKWLGRNYADELAGFVDALLDRAFELIVVCAKEKDREDWMRLLEDATAATVYMPEDLPINPTEESGVVITYTDDKYEYGMESVLLRIAADTIITDGLPMDHGWIVQNTETLYNIYRTLEGGDAVTHKYVHVDGNVPRHRFLGVPVGTPASELLSAAGRPPEELAADEVLADGGPGWCFEIEESPDEFGVTKRTNCVLVLDEDVVAENTLGDERINVLNAQEWTADFETEPTSITPDEIQIPLITNPGFEGVVARSRPIVDEGHEVETGEMIAVPGSDGVSNTQHASVDGTVTDVTETHVEISRGQTESGAMREREYGNLVYWTSCRECGAYIARPEVEHLGETAEYVCRDCR